MNEVKAISIHNFTYDLPEDRVAKHPLGERDASKLLQYRSGAITDHVFKELPDQLQPDDLLIFNDTKVIRARLLFSKPTGSTIEIFCLEPAAEKDPAIAFKEQRTSDWNVLIGNLKRWKDDLLHLQLSLSGATVELSARLKERKDDHFIVRFEWNSDHSFAEVIDAAGQLPIPPYLDRETEPEDLIRYQTVYAKTDGSVAAPTAGLHFTDRVFEKLTSKGIKTGYVTLHVGAGTFRPVKSETMEGHEMHEEKIYIHRRTIEQLLTHHKQGRIVPVGTTSMRTIESLYWFGVQLLHGGDEKFKISQWTPYELKAASASEALERVLQFLTEKKISVLQGSTSLLIAPGYKFHLTNGLITNFHQPNSTLLLLVAAMVGDDWKKIYDHALQNAYRFLSYGDSSLLWRV